jgi:hypothetical protein
LNAGRSVPPCFTGTCGTTACAAHRPPRALLSITVPVTTLLLARAALFRKRMAGDDVPAEVSSRRTGPED